MVFPRSESTAPTKKNHLKAAVNTRRTKAVFKPAYLCQRADEPRVRSVRVARVPLKNTLEFGAPLGSRRSPPFCRSAQLKAAVYTRPSIAYTCCSAPRDHPSLAGGAAAGPPSPSAEVPVVTGSSPAAAAASTHRARELHCLWTLRLRLGRLDAPILGGHAPGRDLTLLLLGRAACARRRAWRVCLPRAPRPRVPRAPHGPAPLARASRSRGPEAC